MKKLIIAVFIIISSVSCSKKITIYWDKEYLKLTPEIKVWKIVDHSENTVGYANVKEINKKISKCIRKSNPFITRISNWNFSYTEGKDTCKVKLGTITLNGYDIAPLLPIVYLH